MVSTRRQLATASLKVKEDSEDDEISINPAYVDVEDELESDWEDKRPKSKAKGQPASKRAKLKKNADASATKRTKITRKKKSMGLLLTMPLDVIFLFFLELSPKDLIALTRTSKSLRETLKARNTVFIWKTVREESKVPDPPHDFSEQRWAALLFGGSSCQVCGVSGIHIIDFLLRRRICLKCKRNNYVFESKFFEVFPDHDKGVLELIPYTNVGAWSQGHASKSRFFWKPDIDVIIRQWSNLKSKRGSVAKQKFENFCKENKDHVDRVRKEAKEYTEWRKRVADERKENAQVLKTARLSALFQKFLGLGYEVEDINWIRYEWSATMPKELTNRAWNHFRPALEEIIIERRDARLQREDEWLSARFSDRIILPCGF